MPRIVVSSVAESQVLRSDGERLRRAIEDAWESGDPIEVDFEGHRIASASFFDESFGVLALRHPLQTLQSRLRPVGLSDADRGLLNKIVKQRATERTEEAARHQPYVIGDVVRPRETAIRNRTGDQVAVVPVAGDAQFQVRRVLTDGWLLVGAADPSRYPWPDRVVEVHADDVERAA